MLTEKAIKVARERKSSVLASNAVHHRVDSLTSIVALLTIGGAHVFTDASWLDPVGGLIIAGMVIRAGWGNTMTSLFELADVTVGKEIKDKIRRSATKALTGDNAKGLSGVEYGSEVEIRDVQGIKSGQNYLIDLELAVPSTFDLQQTSVIESAVRERVGSKIRGVRRVRVKFVPKEDTASTLAGDFISTSVSPRSSPEPEDEHDHDHDHLHANGNGHVGHHQDQRKDK
jgi:divalent metal cation (Fe/Co/Zn/Cd) transporter